MLAEDVDDFYEIPTTQPQIQSAWAVVRSLARYGRLGEPKSPPHASDKQELGHARSQRMSFAAVIGRQNGDEPSDDYEALPSRRRSSAIANALASSNEAINHTRLNIVQPPTRYSSNGLAEGDNMADDFRPRKISSVFEEPTTMDTQGSVSVEWLSRDASKQRGVVAFASM